MDETRLSEGGVTCDAIQLARGNSVTKKKKVMVNADSLCSSFCKS